MKRNESYLVYPVTGLLLVVLLIAVIVGGPPTEQPTGQGEGLIGQNTEPGVAEDLFQPPTGVDSEGLDGAAGLDAESSESAEPTSTQMPLMAIVPTAEAVLERALGTSAREGDYRLVHASRGSTLESMAERWGGGVESLSLVETLNEHLVSAQLREGQPVLVPWVDASELLVANEARLATEAARDEEERARKAVEAAEERRVLGESYTILSGESLWVIASKKGVSPNQIPGWIKKFRNLNPGIGDVDALVPGQKVRLPAN